MGMLGLDALPLRLQSSIQLVLMLLPCLVLGLPLRLIRCLRATARVMHVGPAPWVSGCDSTCGGGDVSPEWPRNRNRDTHGGGRLVALRGACPRIEKPTAIQTRVALRPSPHRHTHPHTPPAPHTVTHLAGRQRAPQRVPFPLVFQILLEFTQRQLIWGVAAADSARIFFMLWKGFACSRLSFRWLASLLTR